MNLVARIVQRLSCRNALWIQRQLLGLRIDRIWWTICFFCSLETGMICRPHPDVVYQHGKCISTPKFISTLKLGMTPRWNSYTELLYYLADPTLKLSWGENSMLLLFSQFHADFQFQHGANFPRQNYRSPLKSSSQPASLEPHPQPCQPIPANSHSLKLKASTEHLRSYSTPKIWSLN